MSVLRVVTKWSAQHGRHYERAGSVVKAHGLVVGLAAELDSDSPTASAEERYGTAIALLRSGEPGPNPGSPEFVDGGQEGVHLYQSAGVAMLEHHSFPQWGALVLDSSVLADFLETMRDRSQSPAYREPDSRFPDIEVPILAAGPGAGWAYLERGGVMSHVGSSADGEPFRHIAVKVDGEWSWVDAGSGDVVRPLDAPPGPSEAPTEGTETDFEQVVRLLGDVAVGSWDQIPRAVDPFGVLRDTAPVYRRLSAAERAELSEYLSDGERRSLPDAVLSLCGRALTENDPAYLSATAMVLEIGATLHDWRDTMIKLAVIHHTAVRLDADIDFGGSSGPITRDHFPQFVAGFENFLQGTDEAGRRLERFGLIETRIEDGIVFKPYEPKRTGSKLGQRRVD